MQKTQFKSSIDTQWRGATEEKRDAKEEMGKNLPRIEILEMETILQTNRNPLHPPSNYILAQCTNNRIGKTSKNERTQQLTHS